MKLMEIITDSEEESKKDWSLLFRISNGLLYWTNGYSLCNKRIIKFDIEYDNGKNNHENMDTIQDETPILK
jgi:hypothetical protein